MARMTAKSEKPLPPDESSGDLEGFVGYTMKRAYVRLSADFRRALGEDGLAPRVFAALSLIVSFPNITQSELARKLGVERSGLVAIIDDLEGRAFVERKAVPGDRRVQALSPTPSGQMAYRHAREQVRRHEEELLSDFSAEEVKVLIGLLNRIRNIEG